MTAFLAIWGALLSSLMAEFEVFRFINRARLRAMVHDGFLIFTPGQQSDGALHLSFTVKNIGSQTTTLESFGVYGIRPDTIGNGEHPFADLNGPKLQSSPLSLFHLFYSPDTNGVLACHNS